MAGPYYYASIVCVTKKDSPYANATGIADLAGGTCTAQTGTIWYDSCLPQIPGADIQTPAETAPAMIMAAGDRHRGLHLHRYAHRHGRRAPPMTT